MESPVLQTAFVGETSLAYMETGAGQPIIFVHGIPTDYRAWNGQVEAFSRRYHMIAYSRRLAKPNQNREDYANSTIENNSEDLIGLIQYLKVSPVHLVGHSYGGFTAAYCAATHPELIRTLVLVEPAVSTILLKDRKNPVQLLSLLLRSTLTAISAAQFQRNSMDPSLAAFDRLPEPSRTMMKENEKTVGEFKSEPPAFGNDVASRISAPTLLINGANSPRVLHAIVNRLAKAIPHSETAKVPGSAHF